VDPEPASQQTAAASGEPPPITPPAPQDPPELHAPRVPAERAAQKPQRPQRVEPQPQPQQAETEAPKAVAIADAAAGNKDRAVTPATLTVGIVPMGQVWIDDRPLGWSPITLPLKPGRYNIAGGRTQPGKQHVVKLKPGETKQVVIDLDGDESSADDTTSSPTSR
jgi:hypothetical protein